MSGVRATRFRPLLKWPGGKTREWGEIEPRLPRRIRDLADPFMGGGAPFALTPFAGHAFLNDRHERLVDLHRRVQQRDEELFDELRALGGDWDALGEFVLPLTEPFAAAADEARAGRTAAPDTDPRTPCFRPTLSPPRALFLSSPNSVSKNYGGADYKAREEVRQPY